MNKNFVHAKPSLKVRITKSTTTKVVGNSYVVNLECRAIKNPKQIHYVELWLSMN